MTAPGAAAPGSLTAPADHDPADGAERAYEELRERVARLEREIAELRGAIGGPFAEAAR